MKFFSILFFLFITIQGCKENESLLTLEEKDAIDTSIRIEYQESLTMLNAYLSAHRILVDSLKFGYKNIEKKDLIELDSLDKHLTKLIQFTSTKQAIFEKSVNLPFLNKKINTRDYILEWINKLDSISSEAQDISLKATIIKERYLLQ
jgi:hypothetical protein